MSTDELIEQLQKEGIVEFLEELLKTVKKEVNNDNEPTKRGRGRPPKE